MALRTALFLLLSVAFSGTLVGCETPDEDYPLGGDTIRIGRTQLGTPTEVSVSQQTDEWEFCHPRSGEFGPWIDCEETRQRAAKLVSITCVPAESCRDAKVDGAKGSFFALAERFSVKVVAEIEGSRVETTRAVKAEKTAVRVSISPEHAMEGAKVEVCRGTEGPATTLSVAVAGAPLAPASLRSEREGCVVFVPPAAGTLTASARLVDPPVDLEAVTATVHARSELRDLEVIDLQCSHRDGAVGAYAGKDGEHLITVSAYGFVDGDDGGTQVYLPSSAIGFRDGDVVLRSKGTPALPSAQFRLERAPSPNAHVTIDLGGRTVTAPVVVRQCG